MLVGFSRSLARKALARKPVFSLAAGRWRDPKSVSALRVCFRARKRFRFPSLFPLSTSSRVVIPVSFIFSHPSSTIDDRGRLTTHDFGLMTTVVDDDDDVLD